MKPSIIALAVASCIGLAGCNWHSDSQESVNTPTVAPKPEDKPIIKADLFLRGLNGDWGTAEHAKLQYLGNNQYETVLRVARGSNQFKIADPGWQIEYTHFTEPTEFDVAQDYYPKPELNENCMNDDCNSVITFKEKGYYKFSVSFADESSATMTVTKATQTEAEKYYADAIIDPAMVHKGHSIKESKPFANFDGSLDTVVFSVKDPKAKLREFGISTTTELRDALDQGVIVNEQAGPQVVTGDVAFDALFAMSLKELSQLSVSEIKDGNYNFNKPIKAEVFETGAKWHYVWTRDLAYAADLSLALMNPTRVENGLKFKLSGFRDSTNKQYDGEQIVQDTGTGGSWPISTDRTTWALGAERLLSALQGEEYNQFAERAYNALSNTLEADRVAAFDQKSGLYVGEQSFLDWRDQTYSTWTPQDVNAIGSSKALSTNVVHYRAMRLAAKLAEQFDSKNAVKYGEWAKQLKAAINDKFWNDQRGMYVSYLFDNGQDIAIDKYDMLGESLAIISGIASVGQAKKIMANYPHSEFGVPVYFPQQPDVPVYHNRAIWPFVTAYSLRAAKHTMNVAAANNAVQSLVRGTATNLSNMENLEWLSGKSFIIHSDHGADASLDGPVINSQRQLWSVGGYLNMVVETIFGIHTESGQLEVKPFITGWIRNNLFAHSQQITLNNFDYKGKQYSVTIDLPPVDDDMSGYYPVDDVKLDDKGNYQVTLGAKVGNDSTIKVISGVKPYAIKDSRVFSPKEPALTAKVITNEGNKGVAIDIASQYKINLYRNGKLIEQGVVAQQYTDMSQGFACYVAESINDQGFRSNPSQPVCVGDEIRVKLVGEYQTLKQGVSTVTVSKDSGTVKGLNTFVVPKTGSYQMAAWYNNNLGQLNTGITNTVKQLEVRDDAGQLVGAGVLQMGHIGENNGMRYSTPIEVKLEQGKVYQLALKDHFNMSYLKSNETYIYAGGVKGVKNEANIADIRITALQ
ncbi:Six-hairpin glycosidase-like protein [Photobacterium jeanii]|uniref:Six-hairpin glycosidase-like protein n=1 Tax=Photobacterium jeanii TaxID=858640 RepID=A0A178KLW6_9GAMM|nr:amylo-alpha-1,6-glucosidase [Photobacterium jeanii]OAN17995.1 Six-hairpin glycosidase-like protein [Photobacterium jeanii]PST92335.1 Six-hairpin glycosidase-like protein [Photobacterium jeanii]